MHLRGPGLRGAFGHAVGAGPPAVPPGHLPARAPRSLRRDQRTSSTGILSDITPLVEPIGLDEAFLDVAGAIRMLGAPARAIAHGLRERVRAELCLGLRRGYRPLENDRQAGFAGRRSPRPAGPVSCPDPAWSSSSPTPSWRSSTAIRWRRCGASGRPRPTACTSSACAPWADLAAIPAETLVRRLGKASGHHLWRTGPWGGSQPGDTQSSRQVDRARGDLQPGPGGPRCELERHVLRMAESVATMLRGASSAARTVTVKVKFSDLSLQTRSHTLGQAITTGGAIGQVAASLLAAIDPGEGIRLLGVSASGLVEGGGDQLSFDLGDGREEGTQSATSREQSWQDATAAIDAIRDKFGRSAVGSASMVSDEGVQVPGPPRCPLGSLGVGHHCSHFPWWCMSANRTGAVPSAGRCTSAVARFDVGRGRR